MIIYLYVKTHKITGLKYLGQTSSKDPYKYKGSGVYWNLHLKKHGNEVDTTILAECNSKEELKEQGLYYSRLWDVVNNPEWANLKEEQGDGGRQSEEVRRQIGLASKGRIPWNKGKKVWSEEDRIRIGEQNKSRGPQTEETIAKRVRKTTGKLRTAEQKERSSLAQKGRKLTEEHKEKLRLARQKGLAEGRIIPWNKPKL